jgi:hypothetical protein
VAHSVQRVLISKIQPGSSKGSFRWPSTSGAGMIMEHGIERKGAFANQELGINLRKLL